MRHIILLLAVAVAPQLHAQSSTTDCHRDYFGNVKCTTKPTPEVKCHGLAGCIASGIAEGQAEGRRRATVRRADSLRFALFIQRAAYVAGSMADTAGFSGSVRAAFFQDVSTTILAVYELTPTATNAEIAEAVAPVRAKHVAAQRGVPTP